MNRSTITYPVDECVPELTRAFGRSNVVILSAPPGAGKTTRVPLALLKEKIPGEGKIVMLEPRRLAARRAAEFMSQKLADRVGNTVGYRIRGDVCVSAGTRVEVLTEGILTRMLQHDAGLPGVGMIIFDEFHERSIHADLGLALSLDIVDHLRQDLRLLIMSATLDGSRLASILGDAPVIESRGKIFPVETHYARFTSDKAVPAKMAETILRAIKNDEGDVLAFLPGWREIQRTDEILYEQGLSDEVVVRTLHGEATSAAQNEALAPDPAGKRKIILSTNVAETSLTIDGVRIVVDSGLVRSARFEPRRGMSELVTIPVSRASADQRRGRAGRQAPGSCYRIWTEAEHSQLPEYATPEILTADLAPLALELAQWGSSQGENLRFIDRPPARALQHAQSLLRELGAIDKAGTITPRGRAIAELPVHPCLAQMILRSQEMGLGGIACTLAALLEERDLLAGQKNVDVDLDDRWHDLYRTNGNLQQRIHEQADRLRMTLGLRDTGHDGSSLGLLVAFAYPERIARRLEKDRSHYVMASGKKAMLPSASKMSRHEYLVISDGDVRGDTVFINVCAPITDKMLTEHFSDRITEETDVRWDPVDKAVKARDVTKLGALVLNERLLARDDARIVEAMIDGIRSLGLESLPWEKETISFRQRSEWIRNSDFAANEWPVLEDEVLLRDMESWLGPFLAGIRQESQLHRVTLLPALKSLFTHRQLKDLDLLAPSHIQLPSGTVASVDYHSSGHPVLAVRIQEMFGQVETPRIGKGAIPLLIHLLSPARRPLAVTQDLPSFWKNTYPGLRRHLQAQYPKHVWPEDPLNARPTNKTKKQFQRRR